jgi:hypothetical protein
MYLGGLVGKAYNNSSISNSFLTTFKDRSTYSLILDCRDCSGYIVANADNTTLITNNFVDSEIYFVDGTSDLWDSAYITIATMSLIKTSLNWDETIWDFDFYGVNKAPILNI